MVGGVKNVLCFYCLSSRVGPSQVLKVTFKKYAWGGIFKAYNFHFGIEMGILSGGPEVMPRANRHYMAGI
jgi:hypothetical protein